MHAHRTRTHTSDLRWMAHKYKLNWILLFDEEIVLCCVLFLFFLFGFVHSNRASFWWTLMFFYVCLFRVQFNFNKQHQFFNSIAAVLFTSSRNNSNRASGSVRQAGKHHLLYYKFSCWFTNRIVVVEGVFLVVNFPWEHTIEKQNKKLSVKLLTKKERTNNNNTILCCVLHTKYHISTCSFFRQKQQIQQKNVRFVQLVVQTEEREKKKFHLPSGSINDNHKKKTCVCDTVCVCMGRRVNICTKSDTFTSYKSHFRSTIIIIVICVVVVDNVRLYGY